jgi:dTDP-4-dehydrorhamnose reductase
MARASREHKVPLVYISSAGIFDGKKQTYDEADIPNPLNVYAKSKYAGELAILDGLQSIVVRASWMMGGGPKKDKKFVNSIIKQIRSGVKELFVVNDKFGNITYTYDLAKTIRFLLEEEMYGLFHATCSGGINRVDLTKAVLEHFGLDQEIKINSVSSSYFKQGYFAKRPLSEMLTSIKMNSAPTWQSCLTDYLNRFEWKI